jgi:signal transduction histidine kinase
MVRQTKNERRQFPSFPTPDWGLFAMVSVSVAIVVLLAAQSYFAIDRELTDFALARRAAIARLATVTLKEKFDRMVDIASALSTRVRFRELVSQGRWAEAIQIFAIARKELPYIDRIILSDAHGVLRAGIPEDPSVIGRSFADRDWYKGVSKERKTYVSDVYQRAAAPQANVFAVATPLRKDDGGIVGTLVLQVRLDNFFGWTKDVDLGSGGYLFVVDRKGKVAFHPQISPQDAIADFSARPGVQRALKGEHGIDTATADAATGARVVAYEPMQNYGWAVIAEQPARDAFKSRDNQLRRLLIAYVLVVLLCVFVAALATRMTIQRRRIVERTAQLEAANKELAAFSYSVSHDLRAPVRAVDAFAHMLEEDSASQLDAEGKRRLAKIRDNSRRMGALIDDLLAFASLSRQTLNPVRLDMEAIIGEVWTELGAGAPARLKTGPLPAARGDRALLRQVWANLLGNALKFSGKREAPEIEISARSETGEVVYCVRDNGAGFDMRYYDKLFGVFQRLHSEDEFPGTGVGLAIVQRIVSLHGGRVWAESKVDEGAKFYFSLSGGSAA